MPGPTPLPVRLTDKQRAELLLLREDDNSRLRARAAIIMACAEGLSNNEVARRENTTPATVARWRRAFLWRWVQGFCEMRRARVARVLLLSFPMTSAKRCCATSAALRCRRASLPVPAS